MDAVKQHDTYNPQWRSVTHFLPFSVPLTRWRDNDPVAGRWLSNDLIGISGGLNCYEAFNNNPVNFKDEFGLCVNNSRIFVGAGLLGVSTSFRPGVVGVASVISFAALTFYELNWGSSVAVTVPGTRITFTGKNYYELTAPARDVYDMHETYHRLGNRNEFIAYQIMVDEASTYLNEGRFAGRPLTDPERVELQVILDIATEQSKVEKNRSSTSFMDRFRFRK